MAITYYEKEIELSDFTSIPQQDNARNRMAINITETGYFTINQQLLSNLTSQKINIKSSSDYKMLIIFDDDSGDIQYPKSGRIKNINFVQELRKHKILLPARYEFSYSK